MMKWFVSFVCSMVASVVCAADAPRIADEHCALRFENGKILVSDASGLDILAIGKIRFVWDRPIAVPKSAAVKDGKIEIDYAIENAGTNDIQMTGSAFLTGHGFRLELQAKIPPNVKSGGQMIDIVRLNKTTKEATVTKCGYWKRCKPAEWKDFYRAGVPFEVRSAYMKPYRSPTQTFWCLNTGWSGDRTECPGFPRKSKDGVFRGSIEFLTGVDSENPHLAAAGKDGRPFVMSFSTKKPFNIFEGGKPSAKLAISSLVSGVRELHVIARDFDGKVVREKTKKLRVKKGETQEFGLTLPAFDCGRGIYFLEASLKMEDGAEECFTRTTLAVLPPHTFHHREKSIAAMAAYPHNENAYRLMERLGVAILRDGDHNFFKTNYNMTAYRAVHAPPYMFDPGNAKHAAHLERTMIEPLKRQGNPCLEFGNEIGWKKSAAERTRLVKCYDSWVTAIQRRLDEENLNVKLITFGLQPDYTMAMMGEMKELGIFDRVSALNLHPGRGYYTADHVHGGWVYRGIIQRARAKFAEMGYRDKDIHMSECYACTHPNDGWKDSYRRAAENTLLNLVIAAAEPNVKSMMFFKLDQGISSDPNAYPLASTNGITTINSEYDFGLLMRDNSPKPSLLSYAATCEHLDGATFLRELSANEKGSLRAFEFKTPRGNLAVLYDRIEGGNYNALWQRERPRDAPKGLNLYRDLEAWEKHWTKSVGHTFKATAKDVTLIDVIGRARTITPDKNGTVTLDLDGEPVMVYGIDLDPVFGTTVRESGGALSPKAPGFNDFNYDYAGEEKSAEQ